MFMNKKDFLITFQVIIIILYIVSLTIFARKK